MAKKKSLRDRILEANTVSSSPSGFSSRKEVIQALEDILDLMKDPDVPYLSFRQIHRLLKEDFGDKVPKYSGTIIKWIETNRPEACKAIRER